VRVDLFPIHGSSLVRHNHYLTNRIALVMAGLRISDALTNRANRPPFGFRRTSAPTSSSPTEITSPARRLTPFTTTSRSSSTRYTGATNFGFEVSLLI